MSCKPLVLTVIGGTNSPETLLFGIKSGAGVSTMDFSAVTRMTAAFHQAGIEVDSADSDQDAGAFDWSLGDGDIVFDFGPLNLAAGAYQVRVTVISPQYPVGLVLNRGDGYTMDIRVVS